MNGSKWLQTDFADNIQYTISLTDAGHYTGNITRNRTVRQDIRTAKEVAEDEALQAFREEHEQVERNREL